MATSGAADQHSLTSSRQSIERNTSPVSQDRRTLAQSIHAALARQQRQVAMLAILKRLDDARREHADHYLAERLRRETSAELS